MRIPIPLLLDTPVIMIVVGRVSFLESSSSFLVPRVADALVGYAYRGRLGDFSD
jgi:hypothetical protein